MLIEINQILKGGPGSGDFGHAGRPGKRGGSGGKLKFSNTRITEHVKNVNDWDINEPELTVRMGQFYSEINIPNEDVISSLSTSSGVSENTVRNYVSSWNGNDISSRFNVAQSVQRVLGTELSPYEKENKSQWIEDSINLSSRMSDYDKITKIIYDDTQKQLKELGISEVIAYRGLKTDTSDMNEGSVISWHGNSLDSWTLDFAKATIFTSKPVLATDFPGGLAIKSSIPANRIFSMSSSGVGTAEEREIAVLGNGPNDEVIIVQKVSP